jgi:hypothetical protein
MWPTATARIGENAKAVPAMKAASARPVSDRTSRNSDTAESGHVRKSVRL